MKKERSNISLELPMLYMLTFLLPSTAKEWERLVFVKHSLNDFCSDNCWIVKIQAGD